MAEEFPWIDLVVKVPAKPLLSRREVCKYLEFGPDVLATLIDNGEFPEPILVSKGTERWRAEWIRWFLWGRELLPRLKRIGPILTDLDRSEPISTDSGGKRRVRPEGG